MQARDRKNAIIFWSMPVCSDSYRAGLSAARAGNVTAPPLPLIEVRWMAPKVSVLGASWKSHCFHSLSFSEPRCLGPAIGPIAGDHAHSASSGDRKPVEHCMARDFQTPAGGTSSTASSPRLDARSGFSLIVSARSGSRARLRDGSYSARSCRRSAAVYAGSPTGWRGSQIAG